MTTPLDPALIAFLDRGEAAADQTIDTIIDRLNAIEDATDTEKLLGLAVGIGIMGGDLDTEGLQGMLAMSLLRLAQARKDAERVPRRSKCVCDQSSNQALNCRALDAHGVSHAYLNGYRDGKMDR